MQNTELQRMDNIDVIIKVGGDDYYNLWKQWSNESDFDSKQFSMAKYKVVWKQQYVGFWDTIGQIDNRPICVSVSFAEINNHRFAFVEGTSQLVDHKMIEEWIEKVAPQAYVTNATNFSNGLRHIQEKK